MGLPASINCASSDASVFVRVCGCVMTMKITAVVVMMMMAAVMMIKMMIIIIRSPMNLFQKIP